MSLRWPATSLRWQGPAGAPELAGVMPSTTFLVSGSRLHGFGSFCLCISIVKRITIVTILRLKTVTEKISEHACFPINIESLGRKPRFVWMTTLSIDVRNNMGNNYCFVSLSTSQVLDQIFYKHYWTYILHKNFMQWVVVSSFYRLGSKDPEMMKNLHVVIQ